MAYIVSKICLSSVLDFELFSSLINKYKHSLHFILPRHALYFWSIFTSGMVEKWVKWRIAKTGIVTLCKVSHSWFDFTSLWYYWTCIFILHIYYTWKLSLGDRLDLGESFVGDEYDLFTILTVVMVLWVHKLIKLPTLNVHSLFYVNFTSIPLFLRIISHIRLKNYYVSCLVFPFQHPVPSVKHPKSSLPQLKQAQLFPLNFYKQN